MSEFKAFNSIPRLFRDCTVTEKIDGTNAVIWISDDLRDVKAGSRTRWVTPGDDNFGFARWVEEHRGCLLSLGPGYHYGEWWGHGIQRGYGLKEKRFSLFDVSRWGPGGKNEGTKPECCHVIPILFKGTFASECIRYAADDLLTMGSRAAPGFRNPEGIVVWHEKARALFKYTFGGDGHKFEKKEV